MISNKQLEKFKETYRKKFKKDISDEDAIESASKLLRMVEITYKPITEKEYQDLQKRRAETNDI